MAETRRAEVGGDLLHPFVNLSRSACDMQRIATIRAGMSQEVRKAFSSDDGSLIRVTNITTHTLGVVLWDADNVGLSIPEFAQQLKKNLGNEEIFMAASGLDKGGE